MDKESLLLHVCCSSCGSAVLEALAPRFNVRPFYYNPNIHPEDEYERRRVDFETLCRHFGVSGITGLYDSGRWHDLIRGLETEPEGGRRCEVCFKMRFREAAKTARENGCSYYGSTLSVSPHKDAERINRIGEEAGREHSVTFLKEDFKKRGGFKRSCELARELGFYRQNYCGCVFSKRSQ